MKTKRDRGRTWMKLRTAIYNRDEGRCRLCACELKPDDFTVDHIQPLAFGGTDEPTNLQSLCKPCHDAKTQLDNYGVPVGGPSRGKRTTQRRVPAFPASRTDQEARK